MANENQKDFNAMLHRQTDMPKIQIITDQAVIQKYGGSKMYFAPAPAYDEIMKTVPMGMVLTVKEIREYLARKNQADFTDPMTAGIFVSIAAWASAQRTENRTPYWRTLITGGELNPKYPGGIEAQKERLEAEGHTSLQKGRKFDILFLRHRLRQKGRCARLKKAFDENESLRVHKSEPEQRDIGYQIVTAVGDDTAQDRICFYIEES